MSISYIETVFLKRCQIMDMHIWLLKAFPRCKMEISSHLININESIYITSFTFFIFDPLKEPFPFALIEKRKQQRTHLNVINILLFVQVIIVIYWENNDTSIKNSVPSHTEHYYLFLLNDRFLILCSQDNLSKKSDIFDPRSFECITQDEP